MVVKSRFAVCRLQPLDHCCNVLRSARNRLRLAVIAASATCRKHAQSGHACPGLHGARIFSLGMEGSAPDSVGTISSWLRCYRCWSTNLEAQIHYEGVLKIDAATGEAADPSTRSRSRDPVPRLPARSAPTSPSLSTKRTAAASVASRPWRTAGSGWSVGTPWVASCTVTVDADQVDTCSGPEAAESLSYAAFGDNGTREFFTHVRFHKHDSDQIVVHMLVELYARSQTRRATCWCPPLAATWRSPRLPRSHGRRPRASAAPTPTESSLARVLDAQAPFEGAQLVVQLLRQVLAEPRKMLVLRRQLLLDKRASTISSSFS